MLTFESLHALPKKIAALPLLKHAPLLAPLRVVPVPIQNVVVERAINHIFRDQLSDGDLDFLEGHFLHIEVTDLGYHWIISKLKDRLALFPIGVESSVSIRGSSREFVLLASRREDPDSLFFQRKLIIDGDTEMGLMIKNSMDCVDLEQLPMFVYKALDICADIAEEF